MNAAALDQDIKKSSQLIWKVNQEDVFTKLTSIQIQHRLFQVINQVYEVVKL
jgi:hypothetical protein